MRYKLLGTLLVGSVMFGLGNSGDNQKAVEQYIASPAPFAANEKILQNDSNTKPATEVEKFVEPSPSSLLPSPIPTATPTPTPKPTIKPTPVPTPKPVVVVTPKPTSTPVVSYTSQWSCNCSKTCPNMSSCDEAQYQLNTCGCGARDADKDGIACDADCQ